MILRLQHDILVRKATKVCNVFKKAVVVGIMQFGCVNRTIDFICPLQALVFDYYICTYFAAAWLISVRFAVTKSLLKLCFPFVTSTTTHKGAIIFLVSVPLALSTACSWNAVFILTVAVRRGLAEVN